MRFTMSQVNEGLGLFLLRVLNAQFRAQVLKFELLGCASGQSPIRTGRVGPQATRIYDRTARSEKDS